MTIIPRERIPRAVFDLAAVIERHGERAWVVGGCLRDLLLGREVNDWDLATTAKPERITAIFPRTIPTGIAHGTVTVLHKGVPYEVTTLRGEGAYSDGRRPDSVFFVDDITRDLERRDFTVNAIAFEPATGEVVDPFGGRADLDARIIRAVRDPMLRFSEDGLRVLRAARFSASLEFTIEPATWDAIRPTLHVLGKVSRERVRDEWLKAMKAARPSRAFDVMRRTGILDVVAGPLGAAEPAAFDLALQRLDAAHGSLVRHAALFSALGHGAAAAAASTRVLTDLRYSNDERATVAALVLHGDPPSRASLEPAAARAVIRAVGRAKLGPWLAYLGSAPTPEGIERAAAWATSVEAELTGGMIFETKELAIRGDELAPLVGGPGPRIRTMQEALLRFVEADPSRNEHDRLLAEAVALARTQTS